MINTLSVETDGLYLPIFISDSESGITAQDILTSAGAASELMESAHLSLQFYKFDGCKIGNYTTSMFGILVQSSDEDKPLEPNYLNAQCIAALNLNEAALKVYLDGMPQETSDLILECVETVHYLETLSESSKVFLPKTCFELSPELESMRSTQVVYNISSSRNESIVPESFDSKYVISLPPIQTIVSRINAQADVVASIDIARTLAPYRSVNAATKLIDYNSIYHTPFFRVERNLKNALPSHLPWINGNSIKDGMEVQGYEKQMYDNLVTIVKSSVQECISDMVNSIILSTDLGVSIRKIRNLGDPMLVPEVISEIASKNSPDFYCDVTEHDVLAALDLTKDRITLEQFSNMMKAHLHITEEALIVLVKDSTSKESNKVIPSNGVPKVMDLSDFILITIEEYFISNKVIPSSIENFLIQFAIYAYRVNWGHSGVTLALPGHTTPANCEEISKSMSAFLNWKLSSVKLPSNFDASMIFPKEAPDDEEELVADEISFDFLYYVTRQTLEEMRYESFDESFFKTAPTVEQSTEASIIQKWRKIHGEDNLTSYLMDTQSITGDYTHIIYLIICLLRWGDNRPKNLIVHDDRVKVMFDLFEGVSAKNVDLRDDSELIKDNGCKYHFDKFVMMPAKTALARKCIIGFLLYKKFDDGKKYYLASWDAMKELTHPVDIGCFQTVTDMDVEEQSILLESAVEKYRLNFYVTDEEAQKAIELGVAPADMCCISALVNPKVTSSMEYGRSVNQPIITMQDRKFSNLRSYIKELGTLYSKHGDVLESATTSVKLLECIEKFRAKDDGISMLSFDASGFRDYYRGIPDTKYMLIYDIEGTSGMPPIEFKDANVSKFVGAKFNNRVVVLMTQTEDFFLFIARDDVTANDLAVKGNAVVNHSMEKFLPVIKSILNGKPGTINKKPIKLHESLKGLI